MSSSIIHVSDNLIRPDPFNNPISKRKRRWCDFRRCWSLTYMIPTRWIKKYQNMIETRNKALQRLHQLGRDPDIYLFNFVHLGNAAPNSSKNSKSTLVGAEIKELRFSYARSRSWLTKLWEERPKDAAVERFTLQLLHKDEDGRDMTWYNEQSMCARRGGCCGRDCGCCKKALDEYYESVDGKPGRKELVKIYGHCTAECACCVITKGFYVPDSCLPWVRGLLD